MNINYVGQFFIFFVSKNFSFRRVVTLKINKITHCDFQTFTGLDVDVIERQKFLHKSNWFFLPARAYELTESPEDFVSIFSMKFSVHLSKKDLY